MTAALLHLTAVFAAFLLPGYCLTRRFVRSSGPLESAVLTVGFGITVPPTVIFVVAWVTGQHYTPWLVLAVSLAIALACLPWRLPAGPRFARRELVAVVVLFGAALALLPLTEFHSVGTFRHFDSCIRSIVLYLTQTDGSGWSLFDPESGNYVTYALTHPGDYVLGISPNIDDVRATNGAMLGSFMVLVGRVTDEIVTLFVYFLIGGAGTLLARRSLESLWGRLLVGLVTLVGLHGVMAYMLNENAFGVAVGLVMLALLLRRPIRSAEAALAGVLMGFAFGIRLPALFWFLPLVFVLWKQPRRIVIAFAVGTVVSMLPWALVYGLLRDNPFYFPGQQDVVLPANILGMTVVTRPLNWPFYESLVHVPGHAVPPLFYVPIKILRSGGGLIVSAMILGFAFLRRGERLRFPKLLVLAWTVPITTLLMLQAYIDYEKASYLAMTMPVMPLVLASFGRQLSLPRRRWPLLAAWVALGVLLSFVPRLLTSIETAEDPRAHEDYRVVIPDTNRWEWQHPQTEAEKRAELGRFALLPQFQDIVYGSELWAGLTHPATGPRMQSGSTYVRMHVGEPKDISFPLHASVEPPPLPRTAPQKPVDLREFEIMVFLVHLRLLSSPEPTVRLISTPEAFRIEVDPGPPPHEPRYVSFVVDEEISDHWTERPSAFSVTIAGQEVEARGLGYHIEAGEQEGDYVAVMTNLALPPLEDVRGEIVCYGHPCTQEWRVYRPDGSSQPVSRARPVPEAARMVPAGTPPLPVDGPVLYR